MPVETTRAERGLYVNRWLGAVTLDDIAQAAQAGGALMQAHGETRVVLVNDLGAVGRLPADTRALRRIAADNPQVIALLVVNAPSIVRLVAEAQAASAPWPIGFYDTVEAACAQGRGLLARLGTSDLGHNLPGHPPGSPV